MELAILSPSMGETYAFPSHSWVSYPKGCLKLLVHMEFKDDLAYLPILVRDEARKVQGLQFGKVSFHSVLDVEAKATFDVCVIVKDMPYIKVIIESDCKIVVNTILGFNSCLQVVFTIVEDIKLFLEDYPHEFVVWINHLDNIIAYESVYWVFNVIRSGLRLVFKISPSIEVVYNHEQHIILMYSLLLARKNI